MRERERERKRERERERERERDRTLLPNMSLLLNVKWKDTE